MVSDDDRVEDALRRLWQPLVRDGSDGTGLEIEVARDDGGWTMTVAEHEPVSFTAPWELLDRLSSDLFQHAVRNMASAVDVHAALWSKGGAVVVFAGAPGAGKSTMTLELLLKGEGWTYLSDDLAPLDLASHTVRPFPKPVSIKDTERWPELAPLWEPPAWLADPQGAFLVPGSALAPASDEARRPTHVVFPERGEPGAAVDEIAPGEAVYALAEMVSRLDAAKLGALSEMCRRATCVGLRYGTPAEGSGAIEDLIAR